MSKFPNRSGSALLVIDVQNNVVDDAWHRDEIVRNINSAVAKARAGNTEVIWIQHSSKDLPIESEGWEIVPELRPLESEPILRKLYRSSFEDTELEPLLDKLGVDHLYITGAQTNNCVRHTSHAALERGYDITLIKDAHTTSDVKWHNFDIHAPEIIDDLNLSFLDYHLPGRKADTVTTAEAVL
ncbi:MAG: isochorismatase family protein [Actinobacteria bacterium]|nr:isochorismatase family protein [Actinomycetota bacterium]